jgi:DNA-binding LacI/PurR family transcriptional regulator
LVRSPRPKAIFCANDVMAMAAIEVARFERSLQVGPQIGIAGFDDIDHAARPSFDPSSSS